MGADLVLAVPIRRRLAQLQRPAIHPDADRTGAGIEDRHPLHRPLQPVRIRLHFVDQGLGSIGHASHAGPDQGFHVPLGDPHHRVAIGALPVLGEAHPHVPLAPIGHQLGNHLREGLRQRFAIGHRSANDRRHVDPRRSARPDQRAARGLNEPPGEGLLLIDERRQLLPQPLDQGLAPLLADGCGDPVAELLNRGISRDAEAHHAALIDHGADPR